MMMPHYRWGSQGSGRLGELWSSQLRKSGAQGWPSDPQFTWSSSRYVPKSGFSRETEPIGWRYILLCMLLLSHFSRVRLCATPQTAAHQAPLCMGFSRQEHWSGLPFPPPVHESEKSKWSRSVVSDSSWPHGLQPTRLLRPWDFPGKSTGVGCHCLLERYLLKASKCQALCSVWGTQDISP